MRNRETDTETENNGTVETANVSLTSHDWKVKPRLEAERCIACGVKNRSGQKIKQKSALRRRPAGGEQGGRVGVAGCIQCICAMINSSGCVLRCSRYPLSHVVVPGRSGSSLDWYPGPFPCPLRTLCTIQCRKFIESPFNTYVITYLNV